MSNDNSYNKDSQLKNLSEWRRNAESLARDIFDGPALDVALTRVKQRYEEKLRRIQALTRSEADELAETILSPAIYSEGSDVIYGLLRTDGGEDFPAKTHVESSAMLELYHDNRGLRLGRLEP